MKNGNEKEFKKIAVLLAGNGNGAVLPTVCRGDI